MKSNIAIDALEMCKAILIDIVKKQLKNAPNNEVKMHVTLPTAVSDAYVDDEVLSFDTITSVSLEFDNVMVSYEDYYKQHKDGIESFTIDEISKIIDAL